MAAVDAFARESRRLVGAACRRASRRRRRSRARSRTATTPAAAARHGDRPQPLARGMGERRGARRAALSLLRDHLQHRAAGAAAARRHQPTGARRERPRGGQRRHPRARYADRGVQFDGAAARGGARRRRAMRSSDSRPRSRSARVSCRSSRSRIRSRASPTAGSCSARSTRRSIGRASPASASACSSSTSTTSRPSTTAWVIPTGIAC